jgi:Phosphatase
MDVMEAYARRLPAADERWAPRPCRRDELERGLLEGGVAGPATHPLDNVRGNILMLVQGDPDKQFGLRDLPGTFSFEDILDLVAAGAGVPIDHEARYGVVRIAPGPILDACTAMGDRLAAAAASRERVVLATGHPIGLGLFYAQLDRLLRERGARVLAPAHGESWRDPRLPHRWFVDHWGGVGMLTDGTEPRHTHSPQAMQRMLVDVRPDLVVADHGFAGAAIEAGVETLGIADVNDPALIVAKAQGRTEVIVVMDDHVAPDAYWPCFQAIAAGFEAPAHPI